MKKHKKKVLITKNTPAVPPSVEVMAHTRIPAESLQKLSLEQCLALMRGIAKVIHGSGK